VLNKKKIAIYSATGCRGCDQTLMDVHYQVDSLTRGADIVFWPYLSGSPLEDLEDQKEVDLCFFSGAIRTEMDRQAAVKLREKSRLMIACGACAAYGGMPALFNLKNIQNRHLSEDLDNTETSDSPAGVKGPALPPLEARVMALSQVVGVDYLVPGCAPRQNFLWAAIQAFIYEGESSKRLSFSAFRLPEKMAQAITSGILPPKGSIFSGDKAVCSSCSRTKEKKQFPGLNRSWEKNPEPGRCLLEQGFFCQGIVTREGCGGLCTAAGLPCRGCFGKTDEIFDPGPKMISAVGSTIDSDDPATLAAMADKFVDLAGTIYRYTLASQCALLG